MQAYHRGEIPADKKFTGQAALILAAMGTTPELAKTSAEIAAMIKAKLVTRQDPERVVAYYMTVWKKSGLVVAVAKDKPADTTAEAGTPEADAEVQAEASSSSEEASEDFTGLKVGDAVLKALRMLGTSVTVATITDFLTVRGLEVKDPQVHGALSNLSRQGKVGKTLDGLYRAA